MQLNPYASFTLQVEPPPPRCSPAVSVRWIATTLMCVFAVVPALALLLASWRTGQTALTSVQDVAQSSLKVCVRTW